MFAVHIPFKVNLAESFYFICYSYVRGYLAIHVQTCFINSSHQFTPLNLAALIGHHVDTIICLVEQGADTNSKDDGGVSKSEYTGDCKILHFVPSHLTKVLVATHSC